MTTLSKYYWPLYFPLKKEYIGIVIIVVLFLWFPQLSRLVDHTAAPIDAGALSAIVLAISALLIFKTITWWLIKSIWPVFMEYSNEHFERNFKSLNPWQKVVIYLTFYLVLLYAFVFTLVAIV